jgi:Tol biopolymer transport system component
MVRRLARVCGLFLLLTNSVSAQQVVFSRRVYAAQGTTYQQLWIWSTSDGSLKQLTHSARDHNTPICSPDGKQVFFDAVRDPLVQGHWRLDRDTGIEQPTNDVPPVADTVARNPLNGRLTQCDDRTWSPSPDGSRLACTASGQDIVIVDVGTQKEIDRIPFEQQYSSGEPYPAWPLQSTWSPDGQTLLVGVYGENSSSTSYQLDYFLLDLATKTWTRAMTGDNAVWLPGRDAIIFETPRDLAPLPPNGAHSVWSAHLAIFDLTTHRETLLTSGITNNIQPTLCGR